MAISCFLAMAGWKISETLVWWPIAKYYALKLAKPATSSEAHTLSALRHARIASTFVASSLSSALAMMMLQHQSQAAIEAKAAAAAGALFSTWTPHQAGSRKAYDLRTWASSAKESPMAIPRLASRVWLQQVISCPDLQVSQFQARQGCSPVWFQRWRSGESRSESAHLANRNFGSSA